MRPRVLAGIGVGAAAGAAAWRARSARWADVALVDVLGRRGGPYSVAHAVDDAGRVAGTARGQAFVVDGDHVTFLTSRGGGRALGMSPSGLVAGGAFDEEHPESPCLWTGSVRWNLDLPPGAGTGAAEAVDDLGRAAGTVLAPGAGASRAVVWRPDGTPSVLRAPGGGSAEAHALGPDGAVVGTVHADGRSHAVWWDGDGRARILPGLGGRIAVAWAAERGGRAAGAASTADGAVRACWWDEHGRCHDLGTLGGGRSLAYGVAPDGTVAGVATTADGDPHACVWDPDGRAVDLGTLGGDTSEARAVNRHGRVVGVASTGAGATGVPWRPGGWSWEEHAFLFDLAGRHDATTEERGC